MNWPDPTVTLFDDLFLGKYKRYKRKILAQSQIATREKISYTKKYIYLVLLNWLSQNILELINFYSRYNLIKIPNQLVKIY